MIAADPSLDPTSTTVYYVVFTAATALAAFFAQRAAKRGKTNLARNTVPENGSGAGTGDRAPGIVLAHIEEAVKVVGDEAHAAHEAAKAATDAAKVAAETAKNSAAQATDAARVAAAVAKDGAEKLTLRVSEIQVSMAEHRGEHKGFQNDLDRLTRKVFNGGTDQHG